MSGSLYYVIVICFFIAQLILFHYDLSVKIADGKLDTAYRLLMGGVLLFYLQDALWGILIDLPQPPRLPLFLSSTLGHLSYAVIAWIWMNYTISYLGPSIRHPRFYQVIGGIAFGVQAIHLIANFFHPIIFHIGPDGSYIPDIHRLINFCIQYLFYVSTGILSVFGYFRADEETKKRFTAIFLFVLAPIVFGLLQLIFSEAPFYACGYFLGCLIIHIYVVADERNDRIYKKAYIDEVSGCWSTSALAKDLESLRQAGIPDDLVVASIDVNGLKEINDQYGHAVGTEMICGSAQCVRRALGRFGKIYRVGGDEFTALLRISAPLLETGLAVLHQEVLNWSETSGIHLSFAMGIASSREFPGKPYEALLGIADNRMYIDKDQFYQDREMSAKRLQGFWLSVSALCTMILQVNLTFNTLRLLLQSNSLLPTPAPEGQLDDWFTNLAASGLIAPEDVPVFLKETNHAALTAYFKTGKREKFLQFRMLEDDLPVPYLLTLIAAEEFSPEFQNLYLYIRKMDF